MMRTSKFRFFSSLVILILILFLGCKKDKSQNQNEIPVVALSITLDPKSTEYYQLNTVGGWVYLTGGYRGIIVYRETTDKFVALERACPYDWNTNNTRITVDNSGITASCPTCKSKFILLDGSVYGGPSTYPMKQYTTSYDGNLLYIYN